ncbi:molybdopterin-binding protein [Azospirillum thermophilum]|uniref:Molybdopterin molybdenumtransferase n=1 Tax=Azospirillum thermophilum TaxID=2202148 RepID=A0A2S2CTX5_9PROT|nr:molybdopterin-binding protein [Azospirillum thermophilum]AWK87727.1 molybdopterin biosynthesis protein [Azospirillum thermophilum]
MSAASSDAVPRPDRTPPGGAHDQASHGQASHGQASYDRASCDRDVRGRGFSGRTPLAEAQARIDAAAAALPACLVPPAQAAGLVLAAPVTAADDLPDRDRAARDGFAVAAADTLGAGSYNPVPLPSALPVSAGQPLPPGCDAVLPVEAVSHAAGLVEALDAVAPGAGVERRGAALRTGATVLQPGRRLCAADVGLLGGLGLAAVCVVPRPRVRLLIAGGPREGGDALTPLLAALVRRDGGEVEAAEPLPAETGALAAALAAPGADLILCAGRTGVGMDDAAPPALAEAGSLEFHGVALRPGDSAALGRVGEVPVVLLPGEPMAALAAYELLGGRAVRRRAGRAPGLPHATVQAVTARKLVSEIGCADLYRVRLTGDGLAEPVASPAVPGLAAAVRADGFVLIPAESEGVPAGSTVTIFLFDGV